MTELRSGTPNEAGMLPERIARVRDLAAGWVKGGVTPALSVLVARRGVVVLQEAFGVLGPDAGAPPLQPDNLFPVTSVTKPFAATVVMSLVEDGLIGLNRPAVEYLPELTGEGKDQILVHHLLTHTWGENYEPVFEHIAQEMARRAEAPGAAPPLSLQTLLEAIYATPLAQPPGEIMEYGALGYLLLGEIVERVSGRSFADLAQERILDPLGMSDSYLVVPESESPRVVRRPADAPLAGPGRLGAGLNSREMEELPYAAGGLYSTPGDLAIFAQTFLNGGRYGKQRILSRPTVAAMLRNQIPGLSFEFAGITGPACMGYGWFVEGDAKWRPMGSLQSLGGVNHMGVGASIVWIDLPRELVGVYLEVVLDMSEEFEPRWNFDLFQNAATAAIAD